MTEYEAILGSDCGFSISIRRSFHSDTVVTNEHLLDLGDVYLSDKAVLRQAEVSNLTGNDMHIKLKWEPEDPSTAADAVHFQLENQNLQSLLKDYERSAQMSGPQSSSAPNSSFNPILGSEPEISNLNFNELFNHVCLVDDCIVPAQSTTTIVLVFVPTKAAALVSNIGDNLDTSGTSTSFSLVRGSIVFSIECYKETHDDIMGTFDSRLEFRARICRSILSADVSELQFLDCVPGQSYVKEFSVWNKSQIPLIFRLVPSVWLSPESGLLECSDYDSNVPIPMHSGRRISAYAHLRIRVTFKPTKVGERDYRIYLENLNDIATSTSCLLTVDILTSVVSEKHQDGLLIETCTGERLGGGSVLSFGDCYSGVVVSRELRVKNRTQFPIDVKLTSDCRGEIKFQLEVDVFRKTIQHLQSSDRNFGTDGENRNIFSGFQEIQSKQQFPGSQSEDTDSDLFQFESAAAQKILRMKKSDWKAIDQDDKDVENAYGFKRSNNFTEPLSQAKRSWNVNEGMYDEEEEDEDGDLLSGKKHPSRFPPKVLLSQDHVDYQSLTQQSQQQGKKIHYQTNKGMSEEKPQLTARRSFSGQGIKQLGRRGSMDRMRKSKSSSFHNNKLGNGPASLAEAIWWTETHAGRRDRANRANNQIEELTLLPGVEKRLFVHFCPATAVETTRENNSAGFNTELQEKSMQLTKRAFKLFFQCEEPHGDSHKEQQLAGELLAYTLDTDDYRGFGRSSFNSTIAKEEDKNRILADVHQNSKAIAGRAKVCTSVLSVSREVIDFGDCQIGEYRIDHITITNHSELPAAAIAYVLSKAVSCTPSDISIPPKGTMDLKIEYVPRRVNPNYRKTITLINCFNAHGTIEIEVRASNTDTHHVLYHSVFYQVLVDNYMKQQQVYFDHVVANSPSLRTFAIRNIFNRPLLFEISSSSPEEIAVYQILGLSSTESNSIATPTVPSEQNMKATRNRFLEDMIWGQPPTSLPPQVHRLRGMDLAVASGSDRFFRKQQMQHKDGSVQIEGLMNSDETLETAIEGDASSGWARSSGDPSSSSKWTIEELISKFEINSCSVGLHEGNVNTLSHIEMVQLVKDRTRELSKAVVDGRLKMLPQKQLFQVGVDNEVRIALVMTLKPVGGAEELQRERTIEHMVHLRLLNVNSSHLPHGLRSLNAASLRKEGVRRMHQELRIRCLLVRAKACRSEMAIAQKNINFGRVAVGERASKTVAISNRSPVPLLYSIRKSGSISSGFLCIPQGRKGVIPAHRSTEIEFVFRPSLAGTFVETLSMDNVHDDTNTQVITIKAKVYKPETFELISPPSEISFGPSLVGEASKSVVKVTMRNTTSRKRQFVVEGDVVHQSAGFSTLAHRRVLVAQEELTHEPDEVSTSGLNQPDINIFSGSVVLPTDIPDSSPTATRKGFFSPQYRFSLETRPGTNISAEERVDLEEKLEQYCFKLRIAERKGRDQKASKLMAKIGKIKQILDGTSEDNLALDGDISMSDSESDSDISELSTSLRHHGKDLNINKHNGLIFSLNAETTMTVIISVTFASGTSFQDWEGKKVFKGVIRIYESRNEDVIKELPCTADVFCNHAAYLAALSPLTPCSPKKTIFENVINADIGGTLAVDSDDFRSPSSSWIPFFGGSPISILSPSSTQGFSSSPLRSSSNPASLAASPTRSEQFCNRLTPEVGTCFIDDSRQRPFFVTVSQSSSLGVELGDSGDIISELVLQGKLVPRESPKEGIKLSASESSRATFSIHSSMDTDIRVKVSWSGVAGMGITSLDDAIRGSFLPSSTASSPRSLSSGQQDSKQSLVQKLGVQNLLQFRIGSKESVGTSNFTHILVVAVPAGSSLDICMRMAPQAASAVTGIEVKEGGERFGGILVQAMDLQRYTDPLISSRSTAGQSTSPRAAASLSGTFRVAVPVVLEPTPMPLLQAQRRVDLGSLNLESVTEASFVIQNICEKLEAEPVKYVAMLVTKTVGNILTLIEHQTGSLPPKGSQEIKLCLKATVVGRWMHDIVIRNLANKNDQVTVTVMATVKPAMYLHFSDLDPAALGKLQEIQIGNIYLSPLEPSKTSEERGPTAVDSMHPLRVRNVSSQHLYLTAIPNLRKQCFIYSYSTSTGELTQVVDLFFPAHADLVLYIDLKPVLSHDAYVSGDVREVVGGIRFMGYNKCLEDKLNDNADTKTSAAALSSPIEQEPSTMTRVEADTAPLEQTAEKLFELTVKFVGMAGVSILKINSKNSEIALFHSVHEDDLCAAYGRFQLENGSKVLPIDYRFTAQQCFPEEKDSVVTKFLASMKPKTAEIIIFEKPHGTVPPNSKVTIEFALLTKEFFGLFDSQIKVENCSIPSEKLPMLRVSVKALVTHRKVIASFNTKDSKEDFEGANKNEQVSSAYSGLTEDQSGSIPIPTIDTLVFTEPIPIAISSFEGEPPAQLCCHILPCKSTFQRSLSLISHCSFNIENAKDEIMYVYPYSDLPIRVELIHTETSTECMEYNDNASSELSDSMEDDHRDDITQGKSRHDILKKLDFCPSKLKLNGYSSKAFKIFFEPGAQTSELPYSNVKSGGKIPFSGSLALIACPKNVRDLWDPKIPQDVISFLNYIEDYRIIGMTKLKGSFFKPQIEIQSRVIDLGKVGINAHGICVPEKCELKIISKCQGQIPILLEKIPPYLAISSSSLMENSDCSSFCWLEPMNVLQIFLSIIPPSTSDALDIGSHWDSGFKSEFLNIKNLFSCEDEVEIIKVIYQVVKEIISISALKPSDGGENEKFSTTDQKATSLFENDIICIPSCISIPCNPSKSESYLGEVLVKNIFSEPVSVELNFVYSTSQISDMLTVNLKLCQVGIENEIYILAPEETAVLQISCVVIPGSRIPPDLLPGSKLPFRNIELGKIEICLALSCLNLDDSIGLPESAEDLIHPTSMKVLLKEIVTVKCNIKPRPTFSVAAKTVQIQISEKLQGSSSFQISNTDIRPLIYSVSTKGIIPGSTVLKPVVSVYSGEIEPYSSCTLEVSVEPALPSYISAQIEEYNSNTEGIPDVVCLYIIDLHSEGYPITKIDLQINVEMPNTKEKVIVRDQDVFSDILSDICTDPASNADKHLGNTVSLMREINTSVLELQNCTPITKDGKRYEINMGRQMVDSTSLEWKVTINHTGRNDDQVDYRLYTLHETDAEWLTLGESRGSIFSGESKIITMYLNRTRMGVFSTYIIMENSNSDLKFIRVEMEVVYIEAGSNKLFQVVVSPLDTSSEQGLVLNFGDVYDGRLYHKISFVIKNLSHMALDFQLSSSLPSSNLSFSLSSVSLMQFKSATIEPESKLQVFLCYVPSSRRIGNDLQKLSNSIWPDESNTILDSNIEEILVREQIYVTCRLVKDFQQVIELRAKRYLPHLRAYINGIGDAETLATFGDSSGILFVAKEVIRDSFVGNGLELKYETTQGKSESAVRVDNISGAAGNGGIVRCGVRNMAMYFNVYLQEETASIIDDDFIGSETGSMQSVSSQRIKGNCTFSIQFGHSLMLRVTPNLEVLSSGEGLSILAKEKYIEEYFMIYNMQRPSEKFIISLKITSGMLRTFFLAPGPKNSYHFWTLEDNIATFLSSYQNLWESLFTARPVIGSILGNERVTNPPLQENALMKVSEVLLELNHLCEIHETASQSDALVKAKNKQINADFQDENSVHTLLAEGVGPIIPIGSQDLDSDGLREVAVRCCALRFEMICLTDELLHCALMHRGYVGDFALKLANLLFSVTFKHQVFNALTATLELSDVTSNMKSTSGNFSSDRDRERHATGDREGIPMEFPPILLKFVAQLDYFISFFPHIKAGLKPLVELRYALLRNSDTRMQSNKSV